MLSSVIEKESGVNSVTTGREEGSNNSSFLPKLPSLTGSRFWAALLVFLFHSSLPSDLAPFADPDTQHIFTVIVGKAGWLGVSCFFILSGFIMVWAARTRDTVKGFYLRRFAKIYPTHCLSWVIAVMLGAVSLYKYKLCASNLLLLNTWFDDVHYFLSLTDPAGLYALKRCFICLFHFCLK